MQSSPTLPRFLPTIRPFDERTNIVLTNLSWTPRNSNAEVGLGLVCACLPACAALRAHHRETSAYKSGSGYGYKRSGYGAGRSRNADKRSERKIYVNHTFQMAAEERQPDDDIELGRTTFDMSQDKVDMVPNAQETPRNGSERRPGSPFTLSS